MIYFCFILVILYFFICLYLFFFIVRSDIVCVGVYVEKCLLNIKLGVIKYKI